MVPYGAFTGPHLYTRHQKLSYQYNDMGGFHRSNPLFRGSRHLKRQTPVPRFPPNNTSGSCYAHVSPIEAQREIEDGRPDTRFQCGRLTDDPDVRRNHCHSERKYNHVS